MQQLSLQEVKQVSGGDGFNLIFVSVNIPNPAMSPAVASLVSRLMNGQLDAASFAQALTDVGGNLIQYMSVSPGCPGPFPGNCMPPMNPPPMP